MLVFALAVGTALVVSFLCSVSEAVLLTVRHSHVEALQGTRAGQILRQFKREIDVPIAAILILNTVAHTAGASLAGATFSEVWDESKLWVFTSVFTVAVLLFTEIVPKTLGVALAERLAVPVAYGVQLMTLVLWPVIIVTRSLSRAITRGEKTPVTSLEEIRLLAALGLSEGVLQKGVAGMIEGTVRLRELRARDVMVPRTGMVFLSGARSLDENLRLAKETGHSRFPFTRSGNPDELDGVVLVKDLLFQLEATPGEPHWESLLGRLQVVPDSMPLEPLLQTFREQRRHLALVVDEYGGTQGLVTMEDVLEEIVGEIEDEYDRVNSFIVKRADGSLLCRGWAETRKVFEALGLSVETDAVSVGGFVSEKVGRVPRAGDIVRADGVEFRVLIASPRRAESIEVRRVAPSLLPPPT